MSKNFGEFIKDKRLQAHITLRSFAESLGVSAPYVTDVEKDRKNPFNNDLLEKAATILHLSEDEKTEMYDLAGEKRNEIAPDIPDYIMQRNYVSAALRTARDLDADEADWMKFVDDLGIYGFSFGRTIPVGRGETYNYATKDFLKKYFDMGRKTSEYALTSKLEFLIDDPLRFKFDCRSKKLLEQNDISELWGGCSAGCNFLYVNMDLDVLSCPVLLEPCGNLKNNTLEEIWKNSNQLMEFRTRIHLKGKCGKCQYKNICGGCRAYALAITNDSLGEDAFCKRI